MMKKYLLVLLSSLPLLATAQSADNPSIAFYRGNTAGSQGDLYTMGMDGSQVRKLGRSGSRPDYYPNWSPDGRQITFQSYREGGWRIWIMDRDGQNAQRLVSGGFGTGSYEFDPTFDETGSYVVFFKYGEGGSDLFKVSVETGKVSSITNTPGVAEYHPDVSPNGQILFSYSERGTSGIATLDPKTGERVRLTSSRNHVDHAPTWSPDGSEILFYSDRESGLELFVMKADGTDMRRLIADSLLDEHHIKSGKFLPLDEGWNICLQYVASFSPDGRRVAFSADTPDGREIFLYDRAHQQLERLTQNDQHDGFPVFSTQ